MNFVYNMNSTERSKLQKSVRNSVIASNTRNGTAKKVVDVYNRAIRIFK